VPSLTNSETVGFGGCGETPMIVFPKLVELTFLFLALFFSFCAFITHSNRIAETARAWLQLYLFMLFTEFLVKRLKYPTETGLF